MTWLEEPTNFDDVDKHPTLSEATNIPLAFGEHFYTQRDINRIIETDNPTIVQPDPYWAGGVSVTRRVMPICSTYGVAGVPHGNESSRNAMYISLSQQERNCPLGERGGRFNHTGQYFCTYFYGPIDGYFTLPNGPGFHYVLDPEKVVKRTEL